MHDEKTSAGTAKMLSGGDTGDRLEEVDALMNYITNKIRSVTGPIAHSNTVSKHCSVITAVNIPVNSFIHDSNDK